jgi:hypothetical protein
MAIILRKKNYAAGSLAAGITSVGTQLTLQSGQGAKFPQDGPFRAVLYGASYASPEEDADREIVEAEHSSGDAFTITRAMESTTAGAWGAGAHIAHVLTAGVLQEYDDFLKPRGCLVRRSTAQSVPHNTWTAVQWNTEDYDTDAIHDVASSNTRLTVPSGVSKVRLLANMRWDDSNSTGYRIAHLRKNGGSFNGMFEDKRDARGASSCNLASPVLLVTGGDYFETFVFQTSGGTLSFADQTDRSWFAMEIIE